MTFSAWIKQTNSVKAQSMVFGPQLMLKVSSIIQKIMLHFKYDS